jgi:hypothetical protein
MSTPEIRSMVGIKSSIHLPRDQEKSRDVSKSISGKLYPPVAILSMRRKVARASPRAV